MNNFDTVITDEKNTTATISCGKCGLSMPNVFGVTFICSLKDCGLKNSPHRTQFNKHEPKKTLWERIKLWLQ